MGENNLKQFENNFKSLINRPKQRKQFKQFVFKGFEN